MTKEEMLEGLTKVRVEVLNDEARLLFQTIMSEFDKRDEYKDKLIKIRDYCQNILVSNKDKDNIDKNCMTEICEMIDIIILGKDTALICNEEDIYIQDEDK